MIGIPEVETERLILRGHTIADLDASLSLWSDPEVVRFLGGRAWSREDVWARLQRYVGHWALSGYGFWLVRERATGALVGEVGIADFKRALEDPGAACPEAGWILARAAQGKGYAVEAMRAVLAWADCHSAIGPRTTCVIEVGNEPSVRVANKLGYREYARATYKGDAVVLFERVMTIES